MKKGVPVVVVGVVVKAVRDGMKDVDVAIAGVKSVEGRECGNGLVVSHRGGWETQYCHLRRGSVAVKAGDAVSRGQRLGWSVFWAVPSFHMSISRSAKAIR